MRKYTNLTLVIVVIILSACGSGGSPPTPPATSIPTETPVPTDTPTPTVAPLTQREESYFTTLYEIRDKWQTGFYSWTLLEQALKDLTPPSRLATTHQKVLNAVGEVTFANTMLELAFATFLASLYCSPTSLDYWSCTQRRDQAKENALQYASKSDAAKTNFVVEWAAAEKVWDPYRVAHGSQPIPTATPFPMPPLQTPAPLKTTVTGVFGTELTVLTVNTNAWSLIKTENSFNDAPKNGHKYIMVKVRVTNRSRAKMSVFASNFSLYAPDSTYEEAKQLNPDDFKGGEIENGSSREGNLSFEVPTTTKAPLVLLYLKGDLVMALK
jgi:hypothetical protein